MAVELSNEDREGAVAYIDAVVARAEGASDGAAAPQASERGRGVVARLVPGFVKRAFVRALIYLLRHPFDHLAHPVQAKLEEEIGQARGVAHAALTRADHTAAEVRRLRAELNRRTSR